MGELLRRLLLAPQVALGIPVPECWAQLMVRRIGAGPADKLLQFARLVAPAEAKSLGMIDQVVPKEQVSGAAVSAPEAWF